MCSQPAASSALPSTPSPCRQGEQARGAAGRAEPDYRPGNQIDPCFRLTSGSIARTRREVQHMRAPWMNDQRHRHQYRWQGTPWLRGLLWMFWLVALGVAAYGGYALRLADEYQSISVPSSSTQTDARTVAVVGKGRPDKLFDAQSEAPRLLEKDATTGAAVGKENAAAIAGRPRRSEAESAHAGTSSRLMSPGRETVVQGAPLASSVALSKEPTGTASQPSALEASIGVLGTPPVAAHAQRVNHGSNDSSCSEPLRAMQLCRGRGGRPDIHRLP